MAIDKLNMKELKDGIDSLELWHNVHEEILEKLGTVKDKIEENEGMSIEKTLETIENFEASIEERSHEIKKKHKEVVKYKDKLEETGVTSVTSGAHIFIENGNKLRKKIKNLLDDAMDNKSIRVDKANKTAIGWGIEKEEKEELADYIDQRNLVLTNMETYLEGKYGEIQTLLNSALSEAKKLEAMDDADYYFSMEHYNLVKKMIEIKVNITKAVAKTVVGFVKGMFSDGLVHGILNIAGCIPIEPIGMLADGVNATLYLAQGDYEAAAWSAAFIIPGTRVGKKIGGTVKNLASPLTESLLKLTDEVASTVKGLASEAVDSVAKIGKKWGDEAFEGLSKKIDDINYKKLDCGCI